MLPDCTVHKLSSHLLWLYSLIVQEAPKTGFLATWFIFNDVCFSEGMISTERLYPILMLSGLPKELMGHIWTLCNKTTPGQLVKQELYQILALIGLAQVMHYAL